MSNLLFATDRADSGPCRSPFRDDAGHKSAVAGMAIAIPRIVRKSRLQRLPARLPAPSGALLMLKVRRGEGRPACPVGERYECFGSRGMHARAHTPMSPFFEAGPIRPFSVE